MEISLEKLFEAVGPWRSIFEPGTATVETKRERILKGICSFACIIKSKKGRGRYKEKRKSANDYLTQTVMPKWLRYNSLNAIIIL